MLVKNMLMEYQNSKKGSRLQLKQQFKMLFKRFLYHTRITPSMLLPNEFLRPVSRLLVSILFNQCFYIISN